MRQTDTLHCNDFENRVHQLWDDRLILSADLTLTEHARKCPECAALMQDYENMELALALENPSLQLPTPSPIATTEFLTRNSSVILALVATLVISLNIYSSYLTKINHSTVVVAQITSPPAIGLFDSESVPARITRRETTRPPMTPITSPSNPGLLIAQSIQEIEVPRIPTWKSISPQIELLKPWIDRSKPLFEYSPALFPVCNIGYQWKKTIKILQQSFLESNAQPGIGKWEQSTNFRTA
jgi:hypothetical protein